MPEFRDILQKRAPGLSESSHEKIVRFRDLVVDENERQNLTRLLSPTDFFEGHVIDCLKLVESGLVGYPAMDLGAGAGVPGIICAILSANPWFLVESEGRKAGFLARVSEELGLEQVKVFSGRGEAFLKNQTVESVVCRAVGPVGRIYAWIEECSTWNNLVLMKGKGWKDEWESEDSRKASRGLRVCGQFDYEVGLDAKARTIVRLVRTRLAKQR